MDLHAEGSTKAVFRTTDPVAGEMLLEVLQSNGLAARLVGTRNGAAIGAGQHIFKLRIEVPAEQELQALELVRAFGPSSLPEDEQPAPRRRRPMLAAGAAVVVPGGAHIYAHRGWTGLLLLAGFVAAIVVAAQDGRAASSAGVVALIAVVLCDLAFGQLAVRATNRGVRQSPLSQLLTGVVLLTACAFLGAAIGPRIPPPKPKYEQYPIDAYHQIPGGGFPIPYDSP